MSFGRRLRGNKLIHNTLALYGMQFCRKIVPLLTIPYLARTLGASGWGRVAFVSSFGAFLIALVEYGFNLSASRSIARNRHNREECASVAAGVLGTQAMLFLGGAVVAGIASRWIPMLRDNPRLLAAGLLYACAAAFAPVWFLQGMEKLRIAAALDITGKILGLIGIFLFVHSPEDGWKVLAVQAFAPGLATLAAIRIMYREIPFQAPSGRLILQALREGWPMFLLRSGTSLYSIANVFMLGLVAPAVSVGYFAGAERLYIAFFGFITPIQDALYPRLSHLSGHAQDQARRLARIGAVLVCITGLGLGLFIFLSAPFLVPLIMGKGFEPAVPVLRILGCVMPFGGLAVAGTQWLLPLGKEREVNRIIFSGGLLNVGLAFLLASRFAHIGMAYSVLAAEAFVGIGMLWIVSRRTSFWQSAVALRFVELDPFPEAGAPVGLPGPGAK